MKQLILLPSLIFISCEYFITESIIEGVKEKGKTIEGKFFS